ncbi:MAG: glycosyltransferase family 2 protein [Firmicutes bacterium]|nr:glycosyltransferase family 2 protein [Bacillota bacterium]
MPKVSIIVPVYNAQKVIERCVNSILGQEYKDFELLLMNDGSKDDSAKILDELAQTDSRVRVVHKQNSGVSKTRNLAISMAKGEYLQFLDADDWMRSNSTKELVRAMEENKVDMVVADFYRVVGENLSRKGSIGVDKPLSLKEYAQYMMDSPADYYYGVVWNKLYKKSIIEQFDLKMDPNLSFCEDFIFNLEYCLHCQTIYPLPVPIYYYVKTEGSLVSQNANLSSIYNMKINVFKYYEKFFKEILNEEEYRQERMDIAKFYVMAAKDEFTIPLFPGTKKIGEEKNPVYFDTESKDIPTLLFYANKAYDRYLNTIAEKHKLDLKDVLVIDAISRCKDKNLKAVEDYTGLSGPQVMLSIQKLSLKGYISLLNESLELGVQLDSSAKTICENINQANEDLEALLSQNMSQEIFKTMISSSIDCLKDFLK